MAKPVGTGQPKPRWNFNQTAGSASQNRLGAGPSASSSTAPAARNPDAMDVDRTQRPPMHCYKCGRVGHITRNCRSTLDIRTMTFDEMKEYFAKGENLKEEESQ